MPRENPILPLAGRLSIVMLLALLAGCATTSEFPDPRDPWESYNRGVYQFNDTADRLVLKPVAQGYRAITPSFLDRGITNFFGNLDDVVTAVNSLLQFKLHQGSSDVGRVMVNSTIGLLGFFDVASKMDLAKHDEDFGQTLGAWGMGPGPYFVLPLLGPSTVRDTGGLVADWYTSPLSYIEDNEVRWGLTALRAIDKRADLLGAEKVLEQAALDPYEFVRDAYLQRRRHLVYDGNPPPEEFDDEPVE